MSESPYTRVDPFIGTEPCDLPAPTGLAANWFWMKPQIGNNHPGACLPFGMVSALPYSGGYPTGYGRWDKSLEGVPAALFDRKEASGFTHFHPTGVGAIRKYYNYIRVTPVTEAMGGLGAMGQSWPITHEQARPGYYACDLGEAGIHCEITVTPRGAVHRYTFPESERAMLLIDLSHGGIAIKDGETVPLRAEAHLDESTAAHADVTLEGVVLSVATRVSGFEAPTESELWHGNRTLGEQEELRFDYIRRSTFEPFGVLYAGPTQAGQTIELALGFSWKGTKKARRHCPAPNLDRAVVLAERAWRDALDTVTVEGGTPSQQRVFYSSLYRSMLKPNEANNESPFWPWDSPFYYDMSTMWDMYKTQLPLMLSLFPQRGADFINSLLNIVEMEGNFPIGYRMARGYDRFAHQASALAHVTIKDALDRGLPGIEWERAVTMMAQDIRRAYGEAFLTDGLVHPITHTLDLAFGCWCTAAVARHVGDDDLAAEMDRYAGYWKNAYDPQTAMLKESSFYEGTAWNYAFRLMHDMPGRIELAGGTEAFVAQLDTFFGVGAEPCVQPGVKPDKAFMDRGYALHRFEGLNNEPDMEVPYAYAYAGRHDRLCEVVGAGLRQMYGDTPGGMVGNDDSGGMTSWYVWSALGLFPVAGQNQFIVGSPLFPKATLTLPHGQCTVLAPQAGGANLYVTQAMLNGKPLETPFLTWQDLGGAALELTMSDSPSGWGRV